MANKIVKKSKRMAVGGSVGYGGNRTNDPVGRGGVGGTGFGGVSGGVNAGGGGRGGPAGGVTTGNITGTSERNMRGNSSVPEFKRTGPNSQKSKTDKPKDKKLSKPAIEKPLGKSTPRKPLTYENMDVMYKRPGTGTNWPGQGAPRPGAPGTANPEGKGDRKMRKGGLVKGGGCASKGVKKPRMM